MLSIDVFVPNYNYARYLRQCVQSILSQEITETRVIIIDNSSTDGSQDVARILANEDSRVHLLANDLNLGAQASFNRAIDLAEADCMMILCADDILNPGALKQALAALEGDPGAAFVIGARPASWLDGNDPCAAARSAAITSLEGTAFVGEVCRSLADDLPAHEVIVRTPVQKRVGHFNPALQHMDDMELVLRLALHGRVLRYDGALTSKRIHSANQLAPLWDDRLADLREREAAFRCFFEGEARGNAMTRRLHAPTLRRIAQAAFWAAVSSAARGDGVQARALFRFGFSVKPSAMLVPPIWHLFGPSGAARLHAWGSRTMNRLCTLGGSQSALGVDR